MYEAQERGKFIINGLKLACVLEGSNVEDISYEVEHVKMHDVLRDMAHWLAREHRNEILVKKHTGLIKSQEIGRWKDALKVSLYGDSTQFLIETPVVCQRLQPIFVMGSKLKTLSGTLFQSIHTLTVLNLSNNNYLRKLPVEIDALISLRYLNLSKTYVSKSPIEEKSLTQLRILLLDEMRNHVVIPPGVISSLLSLEMYSSFSMIDAKCSELECLEKLTDVSLNFSNVNSVLKFMFSPKLQNCITRLSIFECEELRSLDISCYLEQLHIRFCRNLRKVKICFENVERMQRSELNCFRYLQILNILRCAIMENLSWLRYTPRLLILYVIECESLEEIIACDFAGSSEIEEDVEILSNLEQVHFDDLPKLKSICRRAMPFPSLREIKYQTEKLEVVV
ncbi:hypothetical protein Dsin_013494 [Dipteronia sinensis]|uniref:Uncharacterized protein n=1 Tax=Dipteronia sinensis TaxID=43782 RepID=A0AAE0ALA2_9ROSI|nr:hypothetical protein Dsin_013494 [Dipteronia sinensis]